MTGRDGKPTPRRICVWHRCLADPGGAGILATGLGGQASCPPVSGDRHLARRSRGAGILPAFLNPNASGRFPTNGQYGARPLRRERYSNERPAPSPAATKVWETAGYPAFAKYPGRPLQVGRETYSVLPTVSPATLGHSVTVLPNTPPAKADVTTGIASVSFRQWPVIARGGRPAGTTGATALNTTAQGRSGRAGYPAKAGCRRFCGQNGRYSARPLQKMAHSAL
jgi:hypothetical protein